MWDDLFVEMYGQQMINTICIPNVEEWTLNLLEDSIDLLINELPRLIPPKFACLIGKIEAIVLQQIHYLLGVSKKDKKKFKEGKWWTYDSFPDLKEKFFPFWSERTIQRIVANLEKQGVLFIGHFAPVRQDRRNWYAINYAKVHAILGEFQSHNDKMAQ